MPDLTLKRKYENTKKKYFSAISSQQISGKNSESAMKKFLKKNLSFGVDVKP